MTSQPGPSDGLPSRPHRPGRYADLTDYLDAATDVWSSHSSRLELASATAALVVETGRESGAGLLDLADRAGLDTLAALWRDAEPVSLPGALWALYLLRQWCRSASEQVRLLWRAGEPLAAADAVVAGVAEPGDTDSVLTVADAVLAGVFSGDLAVALERAAALFRVVAAGRRDLAGADEHGDSERELARRNDRVAADLATCARLWRAGELR